jgi:CO/xanthine dehydrogenase FAD-binding subunit
MVNRYNPSTLKEALEIRETETVTPYAGGTDLMINSDMKAAYLFINKLPELKKIIQDRETIRIGAACTFTEVIESQLTPAILKEAAKSVGAPAIRNLGTLGGNICNGSPKADSTLVFYASGAKLRLASRRHERVLPIKEFCLGRNKTALQDDELLVEIIMPKTGIDNYYYKKVGAREALAISRVSFAATLRLENKMILDCRTAFGAVSDVIISKEDIDGMLINKTIDEVKAVKEEYLAAYDQAIVPIHGRVSSEYRKNVCMNLLRDFLDINGI